MVKFIITIFYHCNNELLEGLQYPMVLLKSDESMLFIMFQILAVVSSYVVGRQL